ncbi:flavodoxin I [Aequitasia blattaphilus]|uniref:Flavodoxin family protein n=1 Tax=Aequitasia blattaphilus TaxID=2949332 RepID=A0ABT1EF20_9FIRM|nr:flavodoxin family protein [Aequitasia blattaphilus]MCP1103532.1 flavodoxin family protein [Aequitasia blattaphilus]MCR8616172.1 flavodoxin family protein [Aequitasia blattaphilus]
MLDYLVLYQSMSGNTKKIAATIFSTLPGNSKDLIDFDIDKPIPEAKTYFIGFGVHHGTCRMAVTDFLSSLSGKDIALFATCGMGDIESYCDNISQTVSAWIESDNNYLGAFICQGKFPQSFRKKYEECLEKEDCQNCEELRNLLSRFDQALTHPDSLDLEHAKVFTNHIIEEVYSIMHDKEEDKNDRKST